MCPEKNDSDALVSVRTDSGALSPYTNGRGRRTPVSNITPSALENITDWATTTESLSAFFGVSTANRIGTGAASSTAAVAVPAVVHAGS